MVKGCDQLISYVLDISSNRNSEQTDELKASWSGSNQSES